MEKGFSTLEVEEDSLLIRKGIEHLMNGGKMENMIHSSHLIHVFFSLETLMASISTIVVETIRREDNSVANCMANIGFNLVEQLRV
jgi:hypothetical protein